MMIYISEPGALVAPERLSGQIASATEHLGVTVLSKDQVVIFQYDPNDHDKILSALDRVGLKVQVNESRLTTSIRTALFSFQD